MNKADLAPKRVSLARMQAGEKGKIVEIHIHAMI